MIETFNRFWFAQIDARQLALLRICLGSTLIFYLIRLLPLIELHFDNAGWLGDMRQIGIINSGSWSLLFGLPGQFSTEIIVLFAIVLACGFTLGYKTRYCGILLYITLVSIWNRNALVLDGDDAVLRVMLFYLVLSGSANAWSLDALLADLPSRVEVWPLRLIQLQFALIYLVSGWVKFHSEDWSTGAIFNLVLVHPEYSRWNFALILDQAVIQKLLPHLAEFIRSWEILVPFLLLHSVTRQLAIWIGISFHLCLLLFMNLRGFSIIMLTFYLALLPNRYFVGKLPN